MVRAFRKFEGWAGCSESSSEENSMNLRTALNTFQLALCVSPKIKSVCHQILSLDCFQYGEGDSARQRSTAIRCTVASRLKQIAKIDACTVQQLNSSLPNPGRSQWKSAANPLCPTHAIWNDTLTRNGTPAAPLAEP